MIFLGTKLDSLVDLVVLFIPNEIIKESTKNKHNMHIISNCKVKYKTLQGLILSQNKKRNAEKLAIVNIFFCYYKFVEIRNYESIKL